MSDRKLILWDFEDTLAYRPGRWSQAVLDVLREHHAGCTVTLMDVQPFLDAGFPWHQPQLSHQEITTSEAWWAKIEALFKGAYMGLGYASPLASQLAPLAHQRYIDASTWFLYDDVIMTLEALSGQGWKHVILSNQVPELPALVEALKLTPYVEAVFSSALSGYEKPHPQAFLQALAYLNYPITTTWMVGDNIEADILGAQAVGIPAILVHKEDVRAKYVFPDLSFFPAFFSLADAEDRFPRPREDS